MTYLNTQKGVADLFVKDVRECTAKLLNDSSAKTSGMVRDSLKHLLPMIFNASTQLVLLLLSFCLFVLC